MGDLKRITQLKSAVLFLLLAAVTALVVLQVSHDGSSVGQASENPVNSLSPDFVKPSRIIIADDSSYAPYMFLDTEGKPAGITVEFWKLWSSKTGIAVEFRLMQWDAALSAVQNGEADALGGLARTEGRQKNFAFVGPLYTLATSIFFHEQIHGIRGLEDLQGFPVGVVKGHNSVDLILQRYPKAMLLEYPGTESLVKAAVLGEIKVFVADSEVANYYLAKYDQNSLFHETTRPIVSDPQYAAVKIGNSPLLAVLQDGFNQISEKEIHNIVASWTGKSRIPRISRSTMQLIVGVVAGLLSLILLWNVNLRKTVAKALREVERRNLELQDSEARFKAFFDLAPYGFAVNDLQKRYRMVNQAFCRRIGMREEEVVGHTGAELGIITDEATFEKMREELLHTGELTNREVIFSSSQGPRHALYSSRLIEFGGEQLVLSATVDITERKRAEEALGESENSFTRLFESAPIPMAFASEIDGYRATTWNDSWYRTFGYAREEANARSGADIGLWVDPVDRRRFLDKVEMQNYVSGLEVRMRRCDGAVRYCEVFGRFIGKTGHQVLMAAYLDITVRKEAEKALQESEERFSKAFSSSPAPMVISDIETGRFIDFNENWLRMTGYSREDLIGSTSYDLGVWRDPQDRKQLALRLRQDGHIKDFPSQIVTVSGKIRDVIWAAEIINIGGAEVMLSLVYDYTDKKRADEEKEKLQMQLLQSQKLESVGRLAGGVAHDYNNMLGVILGHAELAMLKADESHPLHVHLREIRLAAQRSAELTQQLLAFARRQTIAPKVIDLNRSVTTTLQMLHLIIGENIELVWLPGDEAFPVKIDPSQFDQLLMNLCVNARDAIDGVGRISIETGRIILDEAYCATNTFFTPGDYTVLAVSDTGCGMDKETRAKIFEPFFTTKDLGKGTGLGLATVYGIVKQNDGFINVYSEPGQGTTFRIYLPRYAGLSIDDGELEVDIISRNNNETVLVVEDEAVLLDINTTMLLDLGYKVLAAGSPAEAIRLAGEHAGRIDLLMTDVVMPEMNGRQLEGQVQKTNPGIKVLFMSGYTANVISHHGVLDEGVHFIQKPFTLKDVAMKVRTTLDQKPEDERREGDRITAGESLKT
ncbi:MAG: PAS domain S-box protein [Desulfoprunum sp.]|nr:PAS domain S-box protein [Desulfoprunum sp.]